MCESVWNLIALHLAVGAPNLYVLPGQTIPNDLLAISLHGCGDRRDAYLFLDAF